ncbi:hypothetical protein AA0311_2650 [Asaia bogorensis NBRC 16594]|nr:hypothetical protein AA0311_2650 [Asaia bogorensis NBRC 16594]
MQVSELGVIVAVTAGGSVHLRAPFHPDLACRVRGYRGRWIPDRNAWSFERAYEHNVRGICMSIWGVDGYPERFEDLCDLEIVVSARETPTEPFYRFNSDLYLGGRHIAGVLRKPSIVRPGKQVSYRKGGPVFHREGCGWWLQVPGGSEFVLHQVPRMAIPFFERCLDGHGVLRVLSPSDERCRKE